MSHRPVKPPLILFLYSDTGGGHRSATEAIIESLHLEFDDRIATVMVDFTVAAASRELARPGAAWQIAHIVTAQLGVE